MILLFSFHAQINSWNLLSRVTMVAGKYPSDAIVRDYSSLQMWMYTHANKHPPIDICQSLNQMYLNHKDNYDTKTAFNLHLICAEMYQTIGDADQAYCQFDQADIIAKTLENTRTIIDVYELTEKDRKRKKLEEVGMKLEFHSAFNRNLSESRKYHRCGTYFYSIENYLNKKLFFFLDQTSYDFLKQLNIDNPSAEQARYLWRQIVLQVVLNPNIAIPCAQWLHSYAYYHSSTTLQHANILYVALNLFLLAYGSKIFQNRLDINVFKILDDIGRYFEENGNQSKQFSPTHKMAHVWGAAAIAYYLAFDEYKYLVCACMMRVSFELLGINFRSSGVESLYLLARTHALDFFNMMAIDPGIKLNSPTCINHFRRKLKNTTNYIRYSTDIVEQFVLEVFNTDQTSHRV